MRIAGMMDAFVVVDMAGQIQEFNSMYQALLGYSEAELRQMTYVDLTPERWHASEAGIIQNQVLRSGFSEVYEKEYRKKDGTVFPVELRTSLILVKLQSRRSSARRKSQPKASSGNTLRGLSKNIGLAAASCRRVRSGAPVYLRVNITVPTCRSLALGISARAG
jgi:PAS domain S-box-containing protein